MMALLLVVALGVSLTMVAQVSAGTGTEQMLIAGQNIAASVVLHTD